MTSTSTEGQKVHEDLAPVLVIISGKSLVFSRKIITSTGFYWYTPRRVSTSSGNKSVSHEMVKMSFSPQKLLVNRCLRQIASGSECDSMVHSGSGVRGVRWDRVYRTNLDQVGPTMIKTTTNLAKLIAILLFFCLCLHGKAPLTDLDQVGRALFPTVFLGASNWQVILVPNSCVFPG